jgi:hypothetical protein
LYLEPKIDRYKRVSFDQNDMIEILLEYHD